MIAGSGNFTIGYWIGDRLVAQRVAGERVPQLRDRADIAGMQFVDGRQVLPCTAEMCANFSLLPRVKFCSVASFFNTPEKTLNNEILPANGSLTVLKTYADSGWLVADLPLCRRAVVRCGCAFTDAALDRRRHVVHDEIQHFIGAHIAQAAGEQDREELVVANCVMNAA